MFTTNMEETTASNTDTRIPPSANTVASETSRQILATTKQTSIKPSFSPTRVESTLQQRLKNEPVNSYKSPRSIDDTAFPGEVNPVNVVRQPHDPSNNDKTITNTTQPIDNETTNNTPSHHSSVRSDPDVILRTAEALDVKIFKTTSHPGWKNMRTLNSSTWKCKFLVQEEGNETSKKIIKTISKVKASVTESSASKVSPNTKKNNVKVYPTDSPESIEDNKTTDKGDKTPSLPNIPSTTKSATASNDIADSSAVADPPLQRRRDKALHAFNKLVPSKTTDKVDKTPSILPSITSILPSITKSKSTIKTPNVIRGECSALIHTDYKSLAFSFLDFNSGKFLKKYFNEIASKEGGRKIKLPAHSIIQTDDPGCIIVQSFRYSSANDTVFRIVPTFYEKSFN